MALQVTQVKSANGAKKNQLATLSSLGLRRIRHTVVVPDRPEFRGMVATVNHLVHVAEVPDGTTVGATASTQLSAADAGEPGKVGDEVGTSAKTEELLESQGIEGGADHAADVVQLTPQIDPARGEKVKGGPVDDEDPAASAEPIGGEPVADEEE